MDTIYKILIDGEDKSLICSNISWSDNIDSLGVELNFDIAKEFQKSIELGASVVLLIKDEAIFTGIVVARDLNEFSITCTCFDFAWYLNKSTVIKQFKRINGNTAIKELCRELGINVEVSGAVANIDCIYKDKTAIEVIRDILEKSSQISSKKFNIEMELDTLKIANFKKILVNGKYKLSDRDLINISEEVESISYSDSITEMKNKIIALSGDEKATRYIGEAQDSGSISKYGLLQEVVILDAKDFKNAKTIASNKLKELNKITQDISINLLGDVGVKSGRVINLDIKKYNLQGDYLIKSSSHKIENNIHKVSLTLEVYNE